MEWNAVADGGILSYIRLAIRVNPIDGGEHSAQHLCDAQLGKKMPMPAPKIGFQRLNLR
jgi:hypothetical protein